MKSASWRAICTTMFISALFPRYGHNLNAHQQMNDKENVIDTGIPCFLKGHIMLLNFCKRLMLVPVFVKQKKS